MAVIIAIAAVAMPQIIIKSKRLLLYFPVLGWIEILSEFVVAVGCLGELILMFFSEPEEHNLEAKKIRINWERFWMVLVALGVAAGVPCLIIGLRESAEMNENALKLKSSLRDFVIDQTEPRSINWPDLSKALRATGDAEVNVLLLRTLDDREALGFAAQISSALIGTHWRVAGLSQTMRDDEGVDVSFTINPSPLNQADPSQLLLSQLASNSIVARQIDAFFVLGIDPKTLPTNSIVVVIGTKPTLAMNRLLLDQAEAWRIQFAKPSDETAISNAWRKCAVDEEYEREQKIALGMLETNAPHHGFSPRGYNGDGSPVVPEIPVR